MNRKYIISLLLFSIITGNLYCYDVFGKDSIKRNQDFAFDPESKARSVKEHIDLLRYHLDVYDKYTTEEPLLKKTLKRFFKIYIRNVDGASRLRTELMTYETTDQIRALLDAFEEGKLSSDE